MAIIGAISFIGHARFAVPRSVDERGYAGSAAPAVDEQLISRVLQRLSPARVLPAKCQLRSCSCFNISPSAPLGETSETGTSEGERVDGDLEKSGKNCIHGNGELFTDDVIEFQLFSSQDRKT